MRLEKFPVTTERDEYRVVVKSYNGSIVGWSLSAEIYLWMKKGILKRYGWVKVNECKPESDLGNTHGLMYSRSEFFRGNYVRLAEVAVESYEKYLQGQEDDTVVHEQGIAEWNEWDGSVKS